MLRVRNYRRSSFDELRSAQSISAAHLPLSAFAQARALKCRLDPEDSPLMTIRQLRSWLSDQFCLTLKNVSQMSLP